MLARLAPLALVMVAACRSNLENSEATPTQAARALVGTWECRLTLSGDLAQACRGDDGRVPREHLVATETYYSNGAWSMPEERRPVICGFGLQRVTRAEGVSHIVMDDPVPRTGRWRIVNEGPRRIVVEIAPDDTRRDPQPRTFDVTDADHLAYRENDHEYRMVRVKDAK